MLYELVLPLPIIFSNTFFPFLNFLHYCSQFLFSLIQCLASALQFVYRAVFLQKWARTWCFSSCNISKMSNWKIQVSSCSLCYSVSLKTRLCLYDPLVKWRGSCELKAVWNGLDLIYLIKLLYYSWCQSKMNQLVGIREEKNLKIYEQLFLQIRTP